MANLNQPQNVTMHEAKTHFSRLVVRAEAGEEIIIARGKKPVARLVSLRQQAPPREPGILKGILQSGPEFFEPMTEEELKAWGY